MARRKFDSEAASMFEDEDFDSAYKGNATSIPETNDVDDDDDDADDVDVVDESTEDDDAAWASAETVEETDEAEEDEETDADETEEETVTAESQDDEETNDDDDEGAEVSAARDIISKRSRNVAKKSGEGMTKAEMIRDEIEKRKAGDDSLRACDIIAALKKRGHEVNASQVSVTLRSMGVPSTRGTGGKAKAATGETPKRGRRPKEATPAPAGERSFAHHKQGAGKTPKAPVNGDAFTETEIVATSEFVNAVGGAERGTALLRIFSRMNG